MPIISVTDETNFFISLIYDVSYAGTLCMVPYVGTLCMVPYVGTIWCNTEIAWRKALECHLLTV